MIVVLVGACRDDSTSITSDAFTVSTNIEDAPRWAVRYGDEFWRRTRAQRATDGTLDLGDAIDRVRYAIRADGDLPRVHTDSYTATFDGRGLRVSADSAELRLRTTRVAIGDRVLYDGSEIEWSILGNTAQGRLAVDLVEHYEAGAAGVEVSWIVRSRPTADGDLVVDVATDGLVFARETADGLHFSDLDGVARVRIGNAVAVDARGERWPVHATASATGVRWQLGRDAMRVAEFPLALDPTVGPEILNEASGSGGFSPPAVAASSSNYLVLWGNAPLMGTRISSMGEVLDLNGIEISATASSTDAAVGSNGAGYLVAWPAGGDIYAAGVDASGNISTPQFVVGSDALSERAPSVISNGTDYLVTWWRFLPNSQMPWLSVASVQAARVVMNGTVFQSMQSLPEVFRQSGISGNEGALAMASNGVDYLVGYPGGMRPMAANGTLGTAVVWPWSADGHESIARDGSGYLVVAPRENASVYDLYATQHNADGSVIASSDLLLTTTVFTDPTFPMRAQPAAVALGGSRHLVTWVDANGDLNATRIASDHTIEGSVLPVDNLGSPQNRPVSIASLNSDYLVVYKKAGILRARLISMAECPNGVVENGESCDDGNGTPGDGCSSCSTDAGYDCTGNPSACDIDQCATSNGGCAQICTDQIPSFTCSCNAGYMLDADGHSCNDVNECDTNNGGCDPLTLCSDSPGSFSCGACPSGYTGTGATGCTNVDECSTDNGGCDPRTLCSDSPGSFSCGACPPGYAGTGATGCTDINECDDGGCDPLTICSNAPGSFTCGACPAGYSGTGATGCSDINECETNHGGCAPDVMCINTAGGSMCGACSAGYTSDGITCMDIDECATDNGGCSTDPAVVCANIPGGFVCGACPAGFTGDGMTCAPIGERSGCGCHSSSRPDGRWLIGLGIVLFSRHRRRARPAREALGRRSRA